MTDDLTPSEERMVSALVRSGAIIEADTYAKVDEDAQLAQHDIGSLTGVSRPAVAGGLATAHRKIRAALAGMGAV